MLLVFLASCRVSKVLLQPAFWGYKVQHIRYAEETAPALSTKQLPQRQALTTNMPSPQDIIANLTKLSSTEGAPQVDDGVIALFEHPKWDSARYDINVRDYAKVKRNTVDLHFVDKASLVA